MRSTINSLETPLPLPTVKDRVAIHQTILRLTAIYKGIATAVVIIVAIIWLTLINKILYFGRTLDYSGLEAMGIDQALIKQYNPFFWWTVVIICTLLISYLLIQFVQYTRLRARQKIVSRDHFQQLINNVSPAAAKVIAWAWKDRNYPITVSVLQQSTAQLAVNRYSLICLAKEQENLLENQVITPNLPSEPLHHL